MNHRLILAALLAGVLNWIGGPFDSRCWAAEHCVCLYRRPRTPRDRSVQRLAQGREPDAKHRSARASRNAVSQQLLHEFNLWSEPCRDFDRQA